MSLFKIQKRDDISRAVRQYPKLSFDLNFTLLDDGDLVIHIRAFHGEMLCLSKNSIGWVAYCFTKEIHEDS